MRSSPHQRDQRDSLKGLGKATAKGSVLVAGVSIPFMTFDSLFLTDAHRCLTPRRGRRRIAWAKRNGRSERAGRSTSRAAEGWEGIVLVLNVA